MSNSNQNKPSDPTKQIFPPSLRLKESPATIPTLDGAKIISPEFPAEAKALDGVALAAVTPKDNVIPAQDVTTVPPLPTDTAGSTEFELHEDGTLCKYIDRPNNPPTCSIVDGRGRVFAVAKNAAVADMICNAVNSVNLAMQQIVAEDQAKRSQENPTGAPPALLLPPSK